MNLLIENLTPLEILTLTLIGEVRNKDISEQIEFARALRDRLHRSPAQYRSYKDVCFESDCWKLESTNYSLLVDLSERMITCQPLDEPVFRQCYWIARGIFNWDLM